MGDAVEIEPCSPRVTSQQCHKANNPASFPLESYRRSVVIPVLDEVTSEFDARFSELSVSAGQLVGLVPSVICEKKVNIEEVARLYREDHPNPELLDLELKGGEENSSRLTQNLDYLHLQYQRESLSTTEWMWFGPI